MTVKGSGNTKLELDGKNVLDSTDVPSAAGLYKDNGDGWLTITDKTDDQGKEITSAKKDGSGSLTAQTQSNYGGAAIGGVWGKDTKNIIYLYSLRPNHCHCCSNVSVRPYMYVRKRNYTIPKQQKDGNFP